MHRLVQALTLTSLLSLAAATPAEAISHAPFDALLKKHVKRGKVDYQGIKASDQAQLDAYVTAVGKASITR